MKKVISMVFAFVAFTLAMSSCKKNDPASAIVGTWIVESVEAEGEKMTADEINKKFGDEAKCITGITMTFNKDNTLVCTTPCMASDISGTYSIDGSVIKATADGETLMLAMSDDRSTLVLNQGVTIINMVKK